MVAFRLDPNRASKQELHIQAYFGTVGQNRNCHILSLHGLSREGYIYPSRDVPNSFKLLREGSRQQDVADTLVARWPTSLMLQACLMRSVGVT